MPCPRAVVRPVVASVAVLLALCPAASAARTVDPVLEADLTFLSAAPEYDARVVPAGDVNGDGHEDVVTVTDYQVTAGEFSAGATVWFGPLPPGRDARDAGVPHTALDDWIRNVQPAGDVNGDGRDDLLVERGTTKFFDGLVVLLGAPGAAAPAPGFEVVASDAPPATVWVDVLRSAPLGDVNDDGRADFAVQQAEETSGEEHRVFVVFGRGAGAPTDVDALGAGGYEVLRRPGDRGEVWSGAGDFTGDGRGDVVVDGRLVPGKPGSAPIDLAASGSAIALGLPAAVDRTAPAGDVNGDGRDDLLAQPAAAGRARVLFGRATAGPVGGFDVTDVPAGAPSRLERGRAYPALGDLTGDGRDDLAVGPAVVYGRTATTRVSLRALGAQGFRVEPSALDADPWSTPPAFPAVGTGDVIGDDRPDVAFGLYLLSTPPADGPVAPCTLTGTPGADVLTGTPGADVICGRGGNDRIAALGGDDTVFGGAGSDQVDGGLGADRLNGGDANDLLLGGEGPDRLGGLAGADRLDGGAGDDAMAGGDGADTVLPSDGDDTGDGGAGADRLDGGPGLDRLRGATGSDVVRGGSGDDRVEGLGGQLPDPLGVDVVLGDDGADELLGGERAGRLDGGNGSDSLWTDGAGAVVLGGTGNDSVGTGEAAQRVFTGEGQDWITSAGGRDVLDGGPDADRITVEPWSSSLTPVKLVGGPGEDELTGGPADDVLTGGSDADVLVGGPGRDSLAGDAGDDTLRSGGDGARDTDRCGTGIDAVVFDGALDVLAADCEGRTPA